MRHLTVLLVTGLLAGTASASPIPVSDLDLVINGVNLQYATVDAGIDTESGPSISISLYAGHGLTSVNVRLTSYVIISGATGDGIADIRLRSGGCTANPFIALSTCSAGVQLPFSFTFGVPTQIFEQMTMVVNYEFGSAQGGLGPLNFLSVLDSGGNPVNATFAYSATADLVAAVSNPEPGTWALLMGAGAMLFWFKRKRAGHLVKDAPLVR